MKYPQILLITGLLILTVVTKAGEPALLKDTLGSKETASVIFMHPHKLKNQLDLCQEYKKKEIAGFTLFGSGLGALGGGTYLLYAGIKNIRANNRSNYDYQTQLFSKRDIGFVCGGAALVIAGLALAPGGYIMSTVAYVKRCNYCRAGGAMYITPSQTGLGLALNF